MGPNAQTDCRRFVGFFPGRRSRENGASADAHPQEWFAGAGPHAKPAEGGASMIPTWFLVLIAAPIVGYALLWLFGVLSFFAGLAQDPKKADEAMALQKQ